MASRPANRLASLSSAAVFKAASLKLDKQRLGVFLPNVLLCLKGLSDGISLGVMTQLVADLYAVEALNDAAGCQLAEVSLLLCSSPRSLKPKQLRTNKAGKPRRWRHPLHLKGPCTTSRAPVCQPLNQTLLTLYYKHIKIVTLICHFVCILY